jgi:hypothetical protein
MDREFRPERLCLLNDEPVPLVLKRGGAASCGSPRALLNLLTSVSRRPYVVGDSSIYRSIVLNKIRV